MFQKGDIVRLRTGKSPQRVVSATYSRSQECIVLVCYYLSSEHYLKGNNCQVNDIVRRPRPASDFVFYQEEPVQQLPGVTEMPDLYQLKKEPNRFGTVLHNSAGQPLRNSTGQIVLEMRGEGGKVEAFPEDELELVTPYTVNLCRLSLGDSRSGDQIHVIAEAGQVKKDDVLLELNSGLIWRVTALDTKCRSPKPNPSKWIKLQTEAITFGSNE